MVRFAYVNVFVNLILYTINVLYIIVMLAKA